MRTLAIAIVLCVLTVSTALADNQPLQEAAPSKLPAVVGTGVTVGIVASVFVSYFKFQSAIDRQREVIATTQEQRDKWKQAVEDAGNWRTRATILTGAAIVSGCVTAYLWSRHEKRRTRFAVTATERGATAWLGGSF